MFFVVGGNSCARTYQPLHNFIATKNTANFGCIYGVFSANLGGGFFTAKCELGRRIVYQNFLQSTGRLSAQNVKYQFKGGAVPSSGRTIAGLLIDFG